MSHINDEIESTARLGLSRLREYLENPTEEKEKVARIGLTAVRTHTSAESTQTRRMSAAISAAKLMGVKGDELRPVFEQLTRQPLLLPSDRERSSDAASEAA